jgi:predicted nucleic acid-binding protein
VLSELSNVLLRKMNFPVDKIRNIIYEMTESIEIKPVDEKDILYALDIVERYKISWFDGLIAASAINSKTDTLYSEDLQHGLEIDRSIKIINPFV